MLQKKCVNLKKVSNNNVKTNQEVCFLLKLYIYGTSSQHFYTS